MKKPIITITGSLGSGKSSTADVVAKELGYKRFSSGDFFRKVGMDIGLSVLGLNIRAETDASIDKKTDDEVKKLNDMEHIVVDSRMAPYFVPESFKVYLDLPPEIAKERIVNNLKENKLRQESEDTSSSEDAYQKITDRLQSERKRYLETYGVDTGDKSIFNLVVDTDKNNLQEVAQIIISEYKKWI